MLDEISIDFDHSLVVPDDVVDFYESGIARGKKIHCFDYVPSDSAHVYRVFASLPRAHVCEWGSGMGIATGIARMLGHQATGIEINEELVAESKDHLAKYNLDCDIRQGSYFDLHVEADYYFVYCWPGQSNRVQEHFANVTHDEAKLLICHGAEDIRCRVRGK